jgi:predicted ABC-type ATPase
LNELRPLLVVIAGPMGVGKTTFYDAHLKEAFPPLVPPVPHQRETMLREHRSFAAEDLVVDTELLENARDAGYATKVIFISTEDPNLNIGRILIRMSRGGQSVPLNTIPESYDNTPDGKGHRLVARFVAGELVKTTHPTPEWLQSVIGREQKKSARRR